VYRAVAFYEKLKKNGPTGAALFSFVSTAATYALLEQGNKDKIPIVALGDGRSDTADGRVFPYGFTLLASPWSQSTAEIRFIALQEQCLYQYPELRDKRNRAVKCYRYLQDGSLKEDGLDKLVNRKIANLYLDDAYGRETLPILEVQANRYGFTLVSIPIPPPGIEQETAWQQVATEKPAWILLRGWGVMTPIALKQAARNGFPRYQIIGSVWSGAEEDTVPAGTAAMGFIAASLHATGDTLPAILQIRKLLYRNGKGALQDSNRVGTVLYNQGIIYSLLSTEAIRTAQVEFGHKPLTGEQIRWGLENLQITAQRLAELGLEGLIPPFWTGCKDHEGGAPVHFQQWDGKQWVLVSDWVRTDQSLVRSLVEKSAAAYARGKATPLRDCSIEGS
jgi:branched-chain amino acid transport system substrate-binding protein